MNFSDSKKPKFLTGAPPPTRKITRPDGTIVTEKINPIHCKRKYVDPAGFVNEHSLSTGDTLRNRNAEYGVFIHNLLISKGFLPYDECPLATGRVPIAKGDKPCTGKFSDQQCCPHMEAIIAARKAQHTEHEADFARGMATNQDRMVAAFEEMMKQNAANQGKAGKDGLKFD